MTGQGCFRWFPQYKISPVYRESEIGKSNIELLEDNWKYSSGVGNCLGVELVKRVWVFLELWFLNKQDLRCCDRHLTLSCRGQWDNYIFSWPAIWEHGGDTSHIARGPVNMCTIRCLATIIESWDHCVSTIHFVFTYSPNKPCPIVIWTNMVGFSLDQLKNILVIYFASPMHSNHLLTICGLWTLLGNEFWWIDVEMLRYNSSILLRKGKLIPFYCHSVNTFMKAGQSEQLSEGELQTKLKA